MSRTLAEQLLVYQSNVLPVLLETLSKQLRVSTGALRALEIGYCLPDNCWVFPERDEHGDMVGLSFRHWNGKKYMLKGSKRGLIYVPNVHQGAGSPGRYQAGPQNWVRTSEETPCPLCGRTGWCMVSSENPGDPKAVLCGRVSKGATRNLGGVAGYLHILKSEGELGQAGPVLIESKYPLLIVEGATDVAAASDIGLVAVGRPNSQGGLSQLTGLVAGRAVVVLGENDAGAGRKGMDITAEVLRPYARTVAKLMPPEGIKDLRQWTTRGGLDSKKFLGLIQTAYEAPTEENILASIAPVELADLWLDATYREDDITILRMFHGGWYAYDGQCYRRVDKARLRQQLYQFFANKRYKKLKPGGFDILDYDPNKRRMDEITDALLAFCPVAAAEVPCWLDEDHQQEDPRHILSFPNGLLDIGKCIRQEGFVDLQKKTPNFFSLACYPYDFNPHASCGLWKRFLGEVFRGDESKISLLQEWFGYNLIPDNSHEKFMLLLGPTRAGKSTVLELLAYILGETQVIAPTLREITGRFMAVAFIGKLAAIVGDVSTTTNYDTGEALNVLKRITGNDAFMIERKGVDIGQAFMKFYTRFTMATNTMPRLPDMSRTIEARMLVIKFDISFAGREDTTLKDRLKCEAPGILVWALEGLKRLKRNKEFTLPDEHDQVIRQIRGDITPLTEFIDDCCTFSGGPNDFVQSEDLYECWRNWAEANGEKAYTGRWLTTAVMSLFPESCVRTRRIVNKDRVRVISGLVLRPSVAASMGIRR